MQHLHRRPIHEKREFALHASGGIVAVVFLVWASTLGVRLMNTTASSTTADTNAGSLIAATAAASAAFQDQIKSQSATMQQPASGADMEASPAADQPATQPATVLAAPNQPAPVGTVQKQQTNFINGSN